MRRRNLPALTVQRDPRRDIRPLPRWKLVTTQTPTRELDADDWAELLAFFRESYDIEMEGLQTSILNRPHLVRIRERATKRLVGTVSFGVAPVTLPSGESVRVFYGGDLMLLPHLRGSGLIQELAVRIVLGELIRHPRTVHYGFGVALTHLMYLGLIRSFIDAWPRRDRTLPPDIRFVMETIGRMAYPQTWRSADQPVEVGRKGRGRDLVISEALMGAPDVRFFVERNPDYARGMALPFIMKVDAENLAGLCWRSIRKLVLPTLDRAGSRGDRPPRTSRATG